MTINNKSTDIYLTFLLNYFNNKLKKIRITVENQCVKVLFWIDYLLVLSALWIWLINWGKVIFELTLVFLFLSNCSSIRRIISKLCSNILLSYTIDFDNLLWILVCFFVTYFNFIFNVSMLLSYSSINAR